MQEKLGVAQQFLLALPYARALNLRLDDAGPGYAIVSMPYDPRLIGDPETGVIHGGAVSALLDTCSGAAVLHHPATLGLTATLDLRIEYLRPAAPGDRIVARADCVHVARSVVFVRATAHDSDTSLPVAMATGTFTLDRTSTAKPEFTPP